MSSDEADVIVVGAGPAGSATAAFVARSGLRVTLLEKAAAFPRDKTCGDGITPRAVHMLHKLGVSTDGWHTTSGLRIQGPNTTCEFPWPLTSQTSTIGYCVRREIFDETLARHASRLGAELVMGATVTEPIVNGRGRIVGVRTSEGREFRAPVVVSAEGVASKLAPAMGLNRKKGAISGVAMRAYYASPKADSDHIELHLGFSGNTPGYGWVFPLGDGTVNVGAGMLSTSKRGLTRAQTRTNYRQLFDEFVSYLPADYEINEASRKSPVRGAMLPMALDRVDVYRNGLLLVGDAAGCVNPFNGEGIDYALESAQLASDAIIEANSRGFSTVAAERALFGYRYTLNDAFRGYYRLGIIFAHLVGNPAIMRLCVSCGLSRPRLMQFVNKLLGNLSERGGVDADSRVIAAMSRLVGAVLE